MNEIITLAHGSGGETTHRLLSEEIAVLYASEAQWDDAAVLAAHERIAVTTDSFVVSPLEFPGGDIGKLAATGTINDLVVRGARPAYMTVGLIIEEGLPLSVLRTVLRSLRSTCDEAGAAVVAGDTKVVERGSGDGLFINTTGIGVISAAEPPGAGRVAPQDQVIVSGYLGDHGVAILAAREDLPLQTPIESDCAPLHDLAHCMLQAGGEGVHAMRDPTRGGLAAVLNEIAEYAGVGMNVDAQAIPVRPQVMATSEILGLDPLHLANEGKLVAFCSSQSAPKVLQAARRHPLGRHSTIIGEVTPGPETRVTVRTSLGTTRVLSMPAGELLPRIC